MNIRILNLLLLSAFSFGIVLPGHGLSSAEAYASVAAVPGKIEQFAKDDPKAAAAVIVALASVIIFKDVIVSGAKKTIKMIKENPIVSLGASLLAAGVAYGCWDHYNQESDWVEKSLDSIHNGVALVSGKLSSGCSRLRNWYSSSVKKQFDHMTYESANKARQIVADAKELVRN